MWTTSFCDALDALIMVDLSKAPKSLMDRYLGGEGAAGPRSLAPPAEGVGGGVHALQS